MCLTFAAYPRRHCRLNYGYMGEAHDAKWNNLFDDLKALRDIRSYAEHSREYDAEITGKLYSNKVNLWGIIVKVLCGC